MAARHYGSEAFDPLKGRDAEGNLPAPELTDAEIAQRISEKIHLQREMAERRGTRITGAVSTAQPVAAPIPVDPEQQAALTAARQADQGEKGEGAVPQRPQRQRCAVVEPGPPKRATPARSRRWAGGPRTASRAPLHDVEALCGSVGLSAMLGATSDPFGGR